MSNILDAIRDESLNLIQKEQQLWDEVVDFCTAVEKNQELFKMAGGDPEDLNGLGDTFVLKDFTATAGKDKPNGGRGKSRPTYQKYFPVGVYKNLRLRDAVKQALKDSGPMTLGDIAIKILGVKNGTADYHKAKRRLSNTMSSRHNGRRIFGRKPGTRIWDNR